MFTFKKNIICYIILTLFLAIPDAFADHTYKTSIVSKIMPSVVEVHAEKDMNSNQFNQPDKKRRGGFKFRQKPNQNRPMPNDERGDPKLEPDHLGSGFVISEDGLVITNAHVINNCFKDCKRITVVFQNDTAEEATLINYDEDSDIALLQIMSNKKFPYLKWGNRPELGEDVIAIGSPMNQSFTVTFGNVSALDRFVPNAASFVPFIQTDTAMNPGNSGGPLFNHEGHLIGINTLIITGSGSRGSIGLGFAIDGTYAQAVIKHLKTGKKIIRPYLGIMYRPTKKEDMEDFKYGYGAYIQEVVKNSPAFGILKKGDIILTVDGEWIKWRLIATVVKMKEVGDVVNLEILRDRMKVPIKLELGVK